MSTLTYAGQTFTIRESANITWQGIADEIERTVRDGGGFVDVPTTDGLRCLLVSSSIPVWFTDGESEKQFVPHRIR